MRFIHLGISLKLRGWISKSIKKQIQGDSYSDSLILIQVTAYNSANTIQDAIESLIQQTYSNWVAVVFNDGSTDDTSRILNKLARQDKRVRVVSTKVNVGVNRARNEILKASEDIPWSVMTVLDSDDVAEPYFLADGLELLQKGAKVVRCTNERWDSGLKKKHHTFLACAQVFVRREDVELLGFYRLKPFTADDDFMERLEKLAVLTSGVVCHSLRSLQKMRVHRNNLSKTKGSAEREKYEAKSRRMTRRAWSVEALHVGYECDSISGEEGEIHAV